MSGKIKNWHVTWVFEDNQIFKWQRLEGCLEMDQYGPKRWKKKNLRRCKRHIWESRNRGENFKSWRQRNWNQNGVLSVSLNLMRLNDRFFEKKCRIREIEKMLCVFFSILSNVSGHLHEFQFTIASSYTMNSSGSTIHKSIWHDVLPNILSETINQSQIRLMSAIVSIWKACLYSLSTSTVTRMDLHLETNLNIMNIYVCL